MAATLTSWGTDGSLALSAPLTLPTPPRRPTRGARPGLSLVPPVDAPVRLDLSALGAPDRRIAPAVRGAVRVTRAGRLALTVVTTALLAGSLVLGLTLMSRPMVVTESPSVPALPTVVVHKGQTLSEIARDHLPGMPIHQGVVALQQANGLSSDRIMIGQHLVIPRG